MVLHNRLLYFVASLLLVYASIRWYVDQGERKYIFVVFVAFAIAVFVGLNWYQNLESKKKTYSNADYDEFEASLEDDGDFVFDESGFSIQNTAKVDWDDVEKISIYKYAKSKGESFLKVRIETKDRKLDILDTVPGYPKFSEKMMNYLGIFADWEWQHPGKDEVLELYEKPVEESTKE